MIRSPPAGSVRRGDSSTMMVLLYGRRSINYVYGADGEPTRTEIPLKGHSVEMEFPRAERLDPFGLDYTLRVFRAEQIRA